jgi:hypothetical protein
LTKFAFALVRISARRGNRRGENRIFAGVKPEFAFSRSLIAVTANFLRCQSLNVINFRASNAAESRPAFPGPRRPVHAAPGEGVLAAPAPITRPSARDIVFGGVF